MIKLGLLKRGDFIVYEGDKYMILGLGNRSYNNVQCMNVITHKRIWLDVDTEVEKDERQYNEALDIAIKALEPKT